MGIFGKSRQSAIDKSSTTVIAAGTKITGELRLECRLHVDGEISGLVQSDSTISIGRTGLIEGDLSAKKLVVTGRFIGNADCEEIEILATGRVVGNISSKMLVIERGSFFEGESRLKDPNTTVELPVASASSHRSLPAPSRDLSPSIEKEMDVADNVASFKKAQGH